MEKKNVLKLLPIAGLIGITSLAIILKSEKQRKYEDAADYYDCEDYIYAAHLYHDLGNYKNSRKYYKTCIRKIGEQDIDTALTKGHIDYAEEVVNTLKESNIVDNSVIEKFMTKILIAKDRENHLSDINIDHPATFTYKGSEGLKDSVSSDDLYINLK